MRGEVCDLTRWHARLAVGEQRREESKHVDGTSGPDEKLARGEGGKYGTSFVRARGGLVLK